MGVIELRSDICLGYVTGSAVSVAQSVAAMSKGAFELYTILRLMMHLLRFVLAGPGLGHLVDQIMCGYP